MKTSLILPHTSNFFQVIWWEHLCAATSARKTLKHSEMVYLLCKFHSRAHNPWLVGDGLAGKGYSSKLW